MENETPAAELNELERLALAVFIAAPRLVAVLEKPSLLAPDEWKIMRNGEAALGARRAEIIAGAFLRQDELDFVARWLPKWRYVEVAKAACVETFVRKALPAARMHEPAADYLRACGIAIFAPATQTPAPDAPGEREQQLKDLAAKGLLCPSPACRSPKSRVTKTVQKGNVIVRYRECLRCGHTFTSEEKLRFTH